MVPVMMMAVVVVRVGRRATTIARAVGSGRHWQIRSGSTAADLKDISFRRVTRPSVEGKDYRDFRKTRTNDNDENRSRRLFGENYGSLGRFYELVRIRRAKNRT